MQDLNNFWREKHVNKCSIKTEKEIHIQNFNWTETDKHLSQNKDSIKNLAREDKCKDKLQMTIHSHTEPLGKIWMDSTHKKSRDEDTLKMRKWRIFLWERWKWK